MTRVGASARDARRTHAGSRKYGELLILTSGGNLHAGDAHSFLNRAIVVDESEDQGKPEGSGGKPIACGVIKE